MGYINGMNKNTNQTKTKKPSAIGVGAEYYYDQAGDMRAKVVIFEGFDCDKKTVVPVEVVLAAPELLEAVKEALLSLDALPETGFNNGNGDVREILRQAIAKAEGA